MILIQKNSLEESLFLLYEKLWKRKTLNAGTASESHETMMSENHFSLKIQVGFNFSPHRSEGFSYIVYPSLLGLSKPYYYSLGKGLRFASRPGVLVFSV